jgi:hypothetical protein
MEKREWKIFHNGWDISDRKIFGEMLFDLPETDTIYQNNELRYD